MKAYAMFYLGLAIAAAILVGSEAHTIMHAIHSIQQAQVPAINQEVGTP